MKFSKFKKLPISALVAIVLAVFTAVGIYYVYAVNKTGLVGYWSFDNSTLYSTTTYDGSGYDNHGDINGAATGTAGVLGEAFTFNGSSDYVDCGSSTSLNIGSAYTVELWYYHLDLTDGFLISKGRVGVGDSPNYSFRQSAGTLYIYKGDDSGQNLAFSGAISLGNWYHIVATWDGTTLIAYLNVNDKQCVVV